MTQPDVVIVGAGIAGTSLAWHLASEARVRVIEQAQQHCAEASAQNAGMIRRLVDDPDEREIVCRSWELLREPPTDDWQSSEPFRETGSVVAVADAESPAFSRLSIAADALRARGVDVELLARDEVARVAPALGRSPIQRAFWIRDDGVCDPHALGSGFVRGAQRQGTEFEFDRRVSRLLVEGDRVVGVETDRGIVHADRVVIATAAWTSQWTSSLRDAPRLVPLGRHLFFGAPHPLSTHDHPWCWIEDAGLYVRPETGGFLCSPCDERPVTDLPHTHGSLREVDPETRARTQEELARWFPALEDLRLDQGWIGLRTFAPHRRPMIGPDPNVRGLFWFTGFGGAGVGLAFAAGERAARYVFRDGPSVAPRSVEAD